MLTSNISVKELMTKEIHSVLENDTMDKVSELFAVNEFHHVPVVTEEGTIKGMISKSDYYRLQHGFTLFRSKQSSAYNDAIMRSMLAREVMTQKIVTLKPDDPISIALGIFRENIFHALPVVDEDKRLIGILTTYDLLNHAYEMPVV